MPTLPSKTRVAILRRQLLGNLEPSVGLLGAEKVGSVLGEVVGLQLRLVIGSSGFAVVQRSGDFEEHAYEEISLRFPTTVEFKDARRDLRGTLCFRTSSGVTFDVALRAGAYFGFANALRNMGAPIHSEADR